MYLLFYDITETALRTKVAKLLVNEGFERIQYSVFVSPFNPHKDKLWHKLQIILNNTPANKLYCLKLTKENFYHIKIIGNFETDLKYLTGDLSSLII